MKTNLVIYFIVILTFPIIAFSGTLSGEDAREQLLSTIPTANGTPWQSYLGSGPKRSSCQVSIGFQNYPYRSLSISVIEYASHQGIDGEYHYFQILSADKVQRVSEPGVLKFAVTRNQISQEIEINKIGGQKLVLIVDRKDQAQCFIQISQQDISVVKKCCNPCKELASPGPCGALPMCNQSGSCH